MEDRVPGNVFVFSFSEEGFEAIVNLTMVDQEAVMAKMSDLPLPQSVNSILNMMEMRARFNGHRKMEVWLLKLSEDYTEDELLTLANEDPQLVADMARMGIQIAGEKPNRPRKIIS